MVELQGLVNARDAGAATGLRPEIVLRSDAPLPGDPAPQDLAWPPGTVVDLRGDSERGEDGHPLAEQGAHVERLPLSVALAPDTPERRRNPVRTLPQLYLDLLDGAPRWVPALFRLAARAVPPLLLHCAAGKDRTGICVAVLASSAGASDESIVADYLRTNDVVDDLVVRLREDHPHRPVVPEDLAGVPREAIDGVLERIGPDPAAWCRAQGVASADLDRWRRRAALPAGSAA